MKIIFLYAFFILSAIIFSNCKTYNTINSSNGSVNNLEQSNLKYHNFFNENLFSFNSNILMKANLKVVFSSINQSITTTIEIAKMDSILINISAILGINVGKFFATPDEFIMNNNLESVTYTGKSSRENLMKIIQLELSFNDFVSILKTTPTKQNLSDYQVDYNNNSLSFEDEFATEIIYFSSKDTITKIIRKNKFEQDIFIAEFSNHKLIDNYLFAKTINISFPNQNGNVTINLNEINLNAKLSSPMRIIKPRSFEQKILN